MTDPVQQTVSIRPAARLVETAMKWAEVPTGGALTVKSDGTLSFDFEADDLNAVLSALTGLVLSSHATAKMILPSNVGALRGVHTLLGIVEGTEAKEHRANQLEEARDRLESVIDNLDGLAAA